MRRREFLRAVAIETAKRSGIIPPIHDWLPPAPQPPRPVGVEDGGETSFSKYVSLEESKTFAGYSPEKNFIPERKSIGINRKGQYVINGKPTFITGVYYPPAVTNISNKGLRLTRPINPDYSRNYENLEEIAFQMAATGILSMANWWDDPKVYQIFSGAGVFTIADANITSATWSLNACGPFNDNNLKRVLNHPGVIGINIDEPGQTSKCLNTEFAEALLEPGNPVPAYNVHYALAADHLAANRTSIAHWNNRIEAKIMGINANKRGDQYPARDYLGLFSQVRKDIEGGLLGKDLRGWMAVLPAHSEIEIPASWMFRQAALAVIEGAAGVQFWDWPAGCDNTGCGGKTQATGDRNSYIENREAVFRTLKKLSYVFPPSSCPDTKNYVAKPGFRARTILAGGKQVIFAAAETKDGQVEAEIFGLKPNTVYEIVGTGLGLKTDSFGRMREKMNARVYKEI